MWYHVFVICQLTKPVSHVYPAVPAPVFPHVMSGETSRSIIGREEAEATARLLAKVKDIKVRPRMVNIGYQANGLCSSNESITANLHVKACLDDRRERLPFCIEASMGVYRFPGPW